MVGNFGFIHDKIEVMVLVLFVMGRLPEPVPLDVLTELTLHDEGISYFDLTDCILKLVETKHLKLTDGMYSLTPKGEHNGEILEKNLPYSVRQKAEEAIAAFRAATDRNAMIKTSYNADDKAGYKVALSLSDGVGEILSMEIFAINEKQAKKLERGFRKNAEKIYHSVMKLIAGEK